ncbi:MAG: CBS domain-containing protein, partial [Oscillospiraceae bacterium]|nr:CBS domain-containing protein [Oscillospiraceae bacterium]
MRNNEFLALYRHVESMLDRRMQPRRQSSAVMAYLDDPESRPVRDDLEVCREIRNLLTHNADDDGMPVVEPSEGILNALKRIIQYVNQPPLATAFATPAENLLCARPADSALNLMRAMNKRGFSHAPVLDGERMVGVFSVGTVFAHILKNPGAGVYENTPISAFAPLLPPDAHDPERFLFIDVNATYADVKQSFE